MLLCLQVPRPAPLISDSTHMQGRFPFTTIAPVWALAKVVLPDVCLHRRHGELHSALIKATARWKPMTGDHYGCHLTHAGWGWGDKMKLGAVNPRCRHITIRLDSNREMCCCVPCAHTNALNFKTLKMKVWVINNVFRDGPFIANCCRLRL